jgi:flagellar biosynthesis protein FlhA
LKYRDVIVAVAVLFIILLIIVPINPVFLDILLIINITLSLLILLTNLYIKKPLEFSTFPTLLLFMTLFRLALNISSTTLILGNNGEAGSVI